VEISGKEEGSCLEKRTGGVTSLSTGAGLVRGFITWENWWGNKSGGGTEPINVRKGGKGGRGGDGLSIF